MSPNVTVAVTVTLNIDQLMCSATRKTGTFFHVATVRRGHVMSEILEQMDIHTYIHAYHGMHAYIYTYSVCKNMIAP